jgi:uncharacterized protein (DUF1697 family)
MYTHLVLLRGVNVGVAKRVPMATFKGLLQKLGCEHVKTLLNSGNAVVSRPKVSAVALSREVESALHETLGFSVPVVVKARRDFDQIVSGNNLASGSINPSRLLVVFSQSVAELKSLVQVANIVRPPDAFSIGAKAAYLYCPAGILESDAAKALLGKVGRAVTTRNWATVLKLQALMSAGST